MARKLAPALFYLYKEKKLPKNFRIIGVSRRELSEEGFRKHLKIACKKYKDISRDRKFPNFLKLFSFVRGFFDEPYTYEDLSRILDKRSEVFFYLAVAPRFYRPILENLSRANLNTPRSRILVEKPFGLDLKSARSLNRLLERYFPEKRIYRIDHYLAKDGLSKLSDFRFTEKSIEKIEIFLWETLGAEGRGEFYDKVGALIDVGQNHMLEMLAIATMERPKNFSTEEICENRAKTISALHILSRKEIKTLTYRAQYRDYRKIKSVKRGSRTETYFRVQTHLKSPRFRGVGVIFESGKRLPKVRKEVVIHFKDGQKFVFPVETGVKKYQYVDEYKKILSAAFEHDLKLFLSREEVFAAWRFADPIRKAWDKNLVPLKFYA